jgi:hypothetical protein
MQPTKIFKKMPRAQRLAARRKTAYMQKAAAAEYRARDTFVFGSLRPASPVRRIDPVTGEVVAVIDPSTGAIPPPVNTLTKTRER